MYKKAIQTENVRAFAYEVPMGGYALSLSHTNSVPVLDDEPHFPCIQTLETEMQEIAPLSEWTETLFDHLVKQQNKTYL